jgi:hypothetical protein
MERIRRGPLTRALAPADAPAAQGENLRWKRWPRQFAVMRSILAAALAMALGSCGGSRPAPATPSPTAASAPASSATSASGRSAGDGLVGGRSAADAAPAATTLSRSAVRAAVARGLGAFLQHIEFDDRPVFIGGHFHGFRVVALHDDAFFRGVDLKPGDVVTGVNGFSIERPEQAESVFESLQVASELRVTYERDGHPRELVYAIVDDR